LGLSWFLSVIGTGGVAGVFIRKDGKMPKLTDHYLLLNWNERGFDILAELHHEVLQQGGRTAPLIILTDETLELRQFASFADVYPRNGDPTDEAVLRRANAQDARVVVILADERHGDDRTIRSILQVRKLTRDAKREVRVVAELIDPANDSIVTELAKDFPGRLESVSGLKLRTCVLSQAALTEGITEFYADLLSVKGGTNEVYTLPIPPTAEGWKFSDYAVFVIQRVDARDPLLPVGVYRRVNGKAEVYTNPKEDAQGARLQEGDHLVLIAYGPPKKNALPIPPPVATAA
jgi:hypothetical protein